MREIIEDLARMTPLVLQQESAMGWQGGVTTTYWYTMTPGKYVWVCSFCGYQEYAEMDVYGHPKAHGGNFPHDESCIWQRAKELVDD